MSYSINKFLKRLLHLLLPNKKVNCLFLIHNIESFDGLWDVYEEMTKSLFFHPVVASINRKYPGSTLFCEEEMIHMKLKKLKIPHIRLRSLDDNKNLAVIDSLKPNVIFRQSQWDVDIQPCFSTESLKKYNLVYISYDLFNIVQNVPASNGANTAVASDFHNNCKMIFVPNSLVKHQYENLSINKGNNVYVTGHPKSDRLLQAVAMNKKLKTNKNRYQVLWSAHHSIENTWTNFGMFHLIYKDMLDFAKNNQDIEIILSFHPALITKLSNPNEFITPLEFKNFQQEWQTLSNTKIWEGGPYGKLFAQSDLLLVDGISWLIEYQLTKKPVIFLERPNHRDFNEIGKIIKGGLYIESNINKALELIKDFKNGKKHTLKPQQISICQELLPLNNASQNIVNAIKGNIKNLKKPQ